MKEFIYTGPSWAASSWPLDAATTNLAKEWGLDFHDHARFGTGVLGSYIRLVNSPRAPVVWVYNEPILCLEDATTLTFKEFIQRLDWRDIWEECNQFCLNKINSLNKPVLLIGAHSDIVNCDYPNITVGHPSWQKFLANQAGMTVNNGVIHVTLDDGANISMQHCWGAEVVHRFMHENPDIDPEPSLVDSVWDTFFFWKELEKHDLFNDVHPNFKGNVLFAEHLKPTVVKFLQEYQ